jgi:GH15 family glucan-1,4-alpha-glucosidase
MCWAGCDRLARIARALGMSEREQRWVDAAAALKQSILKAAWNEARGYIAGSLGGEELDASVLLLQEVGLVAADDARFHKTVEAIERVLVRDGHVMRYRDDDDFGQPKTAFTACTFWYIDALSSLGRGEEARRLFEHLLTCRNHVGLLSEDIDPSSGELWGNFPQTYAMAGLILSAMKLSRGWETR